MSSDDCSPLRNLGVPLWLFTTSNFHFIEHSRPLHNEEKSPTASGGNRSGPESHGYAITRSHALPSPRMVAVLEQR